MWLTDLWGGLECRWGSERWPREAACRFDALTAPATGASRVCGSCAHWVQSPGNPAVGACWAKSEEALLVRASEAVCDRGLYQKGATLQQSLLGYSA